MRVLLPLAIALSFSLPAFALHSVFSAIPDKAQVGNGSADIETYRPADKATLEEDGARELKKEYWDKCGPWKTITGRRDAIKVIAKIETMGDRTDGGDRLEKLYTDGKIVAVAGAISNTKEIGRAHV